MILPVQSLALASTTFVGQNLGVGNVERAKGGAALIFCNVKGSDSFESVDHSIFFTEETEALFRRIVERSHSYGCMVGAQIMPGDGRIGGASTRYKVPVSASPCSWMHAPKLKCHPLSLEEIALLEADYRRSVQAALRCGADRLQGFYYARPMPEAELVTWFRDQKERT